MALRLRRGTDAERQTITPLEGELIYTTDTEKLYVGDGTTVGGNPIDSDTITDTLSDLTDVNTAGIQDGQTLAYNLSNTQFEPATLATTINDLTDVDTTGVGTGDVLKWDGASFVVAAEGAITEGATYNINISGNVDGDVTGSVFADDSTLIVDSINNTLFSQSLKTNDIIADKLDPINLVNNLVEISAETLDNVSVRLRRLSVVADSTQTNIGTLQFDGIDKNNGNLQSTSSYIAASAEQSGVDAYLKSKLALGVIDGDGNPSLDNELTITWEGKFGLGTDTPAAKLDVQGEVMFGSFTTTERDALTPSNGTVIYNSTTDKFQGRAGGAWVDLH